MSSQNIEKEVQKALKELTHLYTRVLPVKVGKEVVSSVRQNFRSGGFYGKGWQRTKRQEVVRVSGVCDLRLQCCASALAFRKDPPPQNENSLQEDDLHDIGSHPCVN